MKTSTVTCRAALFVAGGLLAASCSKTPKVESSASRNGSDSADELWAFAPPGVTMAVVARDGSIARAQAGLVQLVRALEKAPGGAARVQEMRRRFVDEGLDLLDPAALADIGLDLTRGAAMFESDTVQIGVLPLGDPDKFLAHYHGSSEGGVDHLEKWACKTIAGRYVCASTAAALAAIAPAPNRMRGMGGDIEIFAGPKHLDGDVDRLQLADLRGFRASISLERGAVTLRGLLMGKPVGNAALLRGAPSPLLRRAATRPTTGVIAVFAARLWQQAIEAAKNAPDKEPLPGGVDTVALFRSMTGDFAIYMLPGRSERIEVRMGLRDPGPMKKVLGACGLMRDRMPPGMTLTASKDRCAVSFDPHALSGGLIELTSLTVTSWVDRDAAVIQLGEPGSPTGGPALSPFARDLLTGDWFVTWWGRGAPRRGSILFGGRLMDQLRSAGAYGPLSVWAFLHLSELGIAARVGDDGVHVVVHARTIWSNPDDVVAEVESGIDDFVAGKPGALAELESVGARHPDSPFAADLAAGPGGLAPALLLTLVPAVAIPAFMRYIERSKEAGREPSNL